MNKTPKLDPMKLTPEQRDKLEAYNHNKEMIQSLRDIADMTQEMISGFDKMDTNSRKDTSSMGALLVDMRDSLTALNEKDSPEAPDYASPIVEAVDKLEKAFAKAIKGIDVKPEVKVDAPQVNVDAPVSVDLKGVEKLLKTDLPKAFKSAIAQIPKVDIPKQSDKWDEVLEQLASIDTGTRMKPQFPNNLKTTIQAFDTSGVLRNVNAVESTTTPGVWGLVVLTSTGADISGGSSTPVDTDNLLLETGDAILLETGDLLLTDA